MRTELKIFRISLRYDFIICKTIVSTLNVSFCHILLKLANLISYIVLLKEFIQIRTKVFHSRPNNESYKVITFLLVNTPSFF